MADTANYRKIPIWLQVLATVVGLTLAELFGVKSGDTSSRWHDFVIRAMCITAVLLLTSIAVNMSRLPGRRGGH
jgi:hypothetical protein